MTDTDLARVMVESDGDLTPTGLALLRRWTKEEEQAIERSVRRWTRWILAVDVGGLPALLLLADWPWPPSVAAWVAALTATVAAAVIHHERDRRRRALALQLRVTGVLEAAHREAAGHAPPRHRREAAPAPTTSGVTIVS